MSAPAIRVSHLSKQYRIGHLFQPYRPLGEVLADAILGPVRRLMSFGEPSHRTEDSIWALRDVSLDVQPGEILGVIGPNGAGKSTLLKILAQITYPTDGRVELRGRVSSLLEVGTGFHRELTGRENVYLSGAILGMKRAEIARKFDEIIAFAGVEKFVDTPVKRYSSGMQLRLAFAVAAHLEPEILLVDEVLAVGDMEFQRKCLGKMNEVAAAEGRTVLFVSHNVAAIESLCDRCLLLRAGRAEALGDTSEVVARYEAVVREQAGGRADLSAHPRRRKQATPIMTEAVLSSGGQEPVTAVRMGEELAVSVRFRSVGKPLRPFLGVAIKSGFGAPLLAIDNRIVRGYRFAEAVEEGRITCIWEKLPLMPGLYSLDLYLGDAQGSWDAVFDALTFDVLPADVFGTGRLPPASCGPFCWPARWTLHRADGSEVPTESL